MRKRIDKNRIPSVVKVNINDVDYVENDGTKYWIHYKNGIPGQKDFSIDSFDLKHFANPPVWSLTNNGIRQHAENIKDSDPEKSKRLLEYLKYFQ